MGMSISCLCYYDDVLLGMNGNWYWCVERNEEVRFVEVDKNELEVIKSLI